MRTRWGLLGVSVATLLIGGAVGCGGHDAAGAETIDTGSDATTSDGGQDAAADGSSDATADGAAYASLCPVFGDQPTCPAASDANGCNLSDGRNCAADALPQGLSCSGMSQCQAVIGPLPTCGRVDAYICSCIDGRWSCDDCSIGETLCEGGEEAYVLPDSGAP
jgi:hypothetical protein